MRHLIFSNEIKKSCRSAFSKKNLLFFLLLLSLVSCQKISSPLNEAENNDKNLSKDKLQNTNNSARTMYSYVSSLNALSSNITCSNGALHFSSFQHLVSTIDSLNNIVDRYNDQYLSNYDSTDYDALDSIDLNNGFNQNQPLEDFDNLFTCLQPLRKLCELEEEQWLDNNGPDLPNIINLSITHSTIDETLQSLLNENNQIYINDSLIILPNVAIDSSIQNKGCTNTRRSRKSFSLPGTGRKFDCIASFQGYIPWGGSLDAKTKSYKKKGRRYYKSRFGIYAAFDGSSYSRPQGKCDFRYPWPLKEKYKVARDVKVGDRIWGSLLQIQPSMTPPDVTTYHNRLILHPWKVTL